MRGLPFEPAPVVVDLESPLDPARAAALLAMAASEGRFVDPHEEERAILRLDGIVLDGAMTLTAQRYATPDVPERTPPPLTFLGEVEGAAGGGSRLQGTIVAPIPSALWVVPALGFALGVLAALNGNLPVGVAGIGFAALAYGVFRVNQWDTLRDAPQLRRGLEELMAGGQSRAGGGRAVDGGNASGPRGVDAATTPLPEAPDGPR